MDEQKSLTRQDLHELEQKIENANTNTLRILQSLLPDPLTKKGGIIQNIVDIEDRLGKIEIKVEQQEKFRERTYWTMTIIATLASIIITAAAILAIFKKF